MEQLRPGNKLGDSFRYPREDYLEKLKKVPMNCQDQNKNEKEKWP